MGQVAHALLTRPPLSHNRFIPEGNPWSCFVRLACVKHAASVHPEPGSNSHVIMFVRPKFSLAKLTVLLNYCLTVFFLTVFTVLKKFFTQILFESFKVISLFSYQGSFNTDLLCSVSDSNVFASLHQQLLHYIIVFISCQVLF